MANTDDATTGMHGTVTWSKSLLTTAPGDPLGKLLDDVLIAVTRGDAETGLPIALQAVANARAAQRWRECAQALTHLGVLQRFKGDYSAAAEALIEAMQIFISVEDHGGRAEALLQLGQAPLETGDYEAALNIFKSALTAATRAGIEMTRARAMRSLALLMERIGRWEESTQLHRQALAAFESHDERAMIAATLNSLAAASLRTMPVSSPGIEQIAAIRQAIEQLKKANTLAHAAGHLRLAAQTHGNLGNAYGLLGDRTQNIAHEIAALEVFQRLGARRDECLSYLNIGRARHAGGDIAGAHVALEHALTITEQHGLRADRVQVLLALAETVGLEAAPALRDEAQRLLASLDIALANNRAAGVTDEALTPDWRAVAGLHSTVHGASESNEIDRHTGLFNRMYIERWYRDFAAVPRDRAIGIILIGIDVADGSQDDLWLEALRNVERALRVDVFGVALSPHVALIVLPELAPEAIDACQASVNATLRADLEGLPSLWIGTARGDTTDSLASLIRRARNAATVLSDAPTTL
jgi:tetratricopeptide (TPR) repeat protein